MSSIKNSVPLENLLLDAFLTDASLQGLTEHTLATYESNLAYFLDWLDESPQDIDRKDLRRFLNHLRNEREANDGSVGLAPSTIKSYFSSINKFYAFLVYEGHLSDNPIPDFRSRYLGTGQGVQTKKRQLISVQAMATLVQSTLDVRNRAIILTLAKTGIRRNELIQLDVDDIEWGEQAMELKETPKRSNTTVFFDAECSHSLNRWLSARANAEPSSEALFTNQYGKRLKKNGVYNAVTKHAEEVGLHESSSDDLQDRFTPHCCRHWFTTHLRRSGMPREFIKELRGDTRGEAVDIYDHINRSELRESYLAHIPTLGIK